MNHNDRPEYLSRIAEFCRQWEEQVRKPNGGKTDLVYSVHFDPNGDPVDLFCSDLSALAAELALTNDTLRARTEALHRVTTELDTHRATLARVKELADELRQGVFPGTRSNGAAILRALEDEPDE